MSATMPAATLWVRNRPEMASSSPRTSSAPSPSQSLATGETSVLPLTEGSLSFMADNTSVLPFPTRRYCFRPVTDVFWGGPALLLASPAVMGYQPFPFLASLYFRRLGTVPMTLWSATVPPEMPPVASSSFSSID